MKRKLELYELVFMALCCVFGLFSKGLISPVTSILTDFIRIPGGCVSTGFSLMFLVIATAVVDKPGVGTIMGFIQGILALLLGKTGYQGVLAILTFTFPGVIIDIVNICYRKKNIQYFLLSSMTGNIASAFLSNLLVFHFESLTLFLWLLLATCSGIATGFVAIILFKFIIKLK